MPRCAWCGRCSGSAQDQPLALVERTADKVQEVIGGDRRGLLAQPYLKQVLRDYVHLTGQLGPGTGHFVGRKEGEVPHSSERPSSQARSSHRPAAGPPPGSGSRRMGSTGVQGLRHHALLGPHHARVDEAHAVRPHQHEAHVGVQACCVEPLRPGPAPSARSLPAWRC